MSGNPNRTLRVDDATWNRALEQAKQEGTTIAVAMREFLTAYGNGKIPGRYGKGSETS